jgi:hypothetical protein
MIILIAGKLNRAHYSVRLHTTFQVLTHMCENVCGHVEMFSRFVTGYDVSLHFFCLHQHVTAKLMVIHVCIGAYFESNLLIVWYIFISNISKWEYIYLTVW